VKHSIFDGDMARHFRYHNRLVRLCQTLAAVGVDAGVFNRLAPKELRTVADNRVIRWHLEDRLRELLRRNGDYPPKARRKR
jgi:hypothetical protein